MAQLSREASCFHHGQEPVEGRAQGRPGDHTATSASDSLKTFETSAFGTACVG